MEAPHRPIGAKGVMPDDTLSTPTPSMHPTSASTASSATLLVAAMSSPSPALIPPSSSSAGVVVVSAPGRTASKLTPSDFLPSVLLGEGSYSQVYLVQSRVDGGRYAMKVLSKAHLQRHARTSVALAEKAALSRCCHPNIVRLYHTFQDASSLYFILELCERGDVLDELEQLQAAAYPLDVVRFYAAQLLWALHYLHHTAHILHRDVKPENLLLNSQRHIKLADFGTAKTLTTPPAAAAASATVPPAAAAAPAVAKKHSFVGTAAYVAPEILREGKVGYGVDQWSAGCSIYHMLTRCTPFHAASEYLTFQRILQGELSIDASVDADAADLIRRLMRSDATQRLGSREEDWAEVELHPFFAGHVDWRRIREGTAQCPPLPPVKEKKFSLLNEDSVLGWSSPAARAERGGDGDMEEQEVEEVEEGDALDELADDDGEEERARGQLLSEPAGGEDGHYRSEHAEGTANGSGEAQEADRQRSNERLHTQDVVALTRPAQQPPPARPPFITPSPTCDPPPSLFASVAGVPPSTLQPSESVLLSSSIRATSSSPPSLLSSCFPCLLRTTAPTPASPALSPSPPSSSSPILLLFTSAGRVLLVHPADGGAAQQASRVQPGKVVSQWQMGAGTGEARLDSRAGASGGKEERLRLIDGQGGVMEWEVVSGATASAWAAAAEQPRPPASTSSGRAAAALPSMHMAIVSHTT